MGLNNGDVGCGNGCINSHALSQCNDSSYFKYMDGDVEDGDVSSGHGSMNSHTIYWYNGFISFTNLNICDDIEINNKLNNGDVSCEFW